MSSYYEVVPESLLVAIGSSKEVALAFQSLWGGGSGMYGWFTELSEDVIAEIAENGNVPADAIEKLRGLLSRSEAYPGAYIEKTHNEHQTMLRSAFAAAGVPNADQLASIAILGEQDWGHGTDLAIISNDQCDVISTLAKQFDVVGIVRGFDLGSRETARVWRDNLTRELQGLVDCYRIAAQHGHHVLTGIS